VDKDLRPQDIKVLPALSQIKWGERIFRLEFASEEGLDFSSSFFPPLTGQNLRFLQDGQIQGLGVADYLLQRHSYDPVAL